MLRIHKAGVLQSDFEDTNVLVSENEEVRTFDFGQASRHDCRCSPELEVWRYEPSRYGYGCDEMHDVMQTLELWTPGKCARYSRPHLTTLTCSCPTVRVPFCGFFFILSFPEPESLVDFCLSCHSNPEDPEVKEELRKKAEKALAECYSKYEERFRYIGHPEDIKKLLEGGGAQRAAENGGVPSSQG